MMLMNMLLLLLLCLEDDALLHLLEPFQELLLLRR